MESKVGMGRVYQDFEPSMEWVPEDDSDTLLLYLPGFAKEQLRVQLRSRNLIISGERKLQQNTWSRFRVEFPVSANCDVNKISAKFEGSILFVTQPKLTTTAPKQEEETSPAGAVDEPKTGVTKASPSTTPSADMRKKELGKEDDQEEEVPKAGLQEEAEKSQEIKERAAAPEEPKEGVMHERVRGRREEEVDQKTAKTALENYREAVGAFAAMLRTSTSAVNTTVILLVGLVLGAYLAASIQSSWMTS